MPGEEGQHLGSQRISDVQRGGLDREEPRWVWRTPWPGVWQEDSTAALSILSNQGPFPCFETRLIFDAFKIRNEMKISEKKRKTCQRGQRVIRPPLDSAPMVCKTRQIIAHRVSVLGSPGLCCSVPLSPRILLGCLENPLGHSGNHTRVGCLAVTQHGGGYYSWGWRRVLPTQGDSSLLPLLWALYWPG